MPHNFIPDLIKSLNKIKRVPRIVVMPDFFIDHFVIIDSDIETFIEKFRIIAHQGGGNLIGTRQMIQRGGNSANIASALFKLGSKIKLITKTSPMGLYYLKGFLGPDFDYSGVKTNGKLSMTVSIELKHNNGTTNVMLSDSGSAGDFKFTDLNENDITNIMNSDLIAVVCVNHNRYGAELAKKVFQVAKRSGATTYLDVGDPSLVPERIEEVVKYVLETGNADIFSANENEVMRFAAYFESKYTRFIGMTQDSTIYRQAAMKLSEHIACRLDLHTKTFSASYFNGKEIAISPTFKVSAKIGCGAGDSWNAGNIFGEVLKFNDNLRLLFANAIGSLYVSMGSALHPTLNEIMEFLKANPTQYQI